MLSQAAFFNCTDLDPDGAVKDFQLKMKKYIFIFLVAYVVLGIVVGKFLVEGAGVYGLAHAIWGTVAVCLSGVIAGWFFAKIEGRGATSEEAKSYSRWSIGLIYIWALIGVASLFGVLANPYALSFVIAGLMASPWFSLLMIIILFGSILVQYRVNKWSFLVLSRRGS